MYRYSPGMAEPILVRGTADQDETIKPSPAFRPAPSTLLHSWAKQAAARYIPEDCRLCGIPLSVASRIPVCLDCLASAAQPYGVERNRDSLPINFPRNTLLTTGDCPWFN